MGIEMKELHCVPCGELFPVDRFAHGNHIDCEKVAAARKAREEAQPYRGTVVDSSYVPKPLVLPSVQLVSDEQAIFAVSGDVVLDWTYEDNADFNRNEEDLNQPPSTSHQLKEAQVNSEWRKYSADVIAFVAKESESYVSVSPERWAKWVEKHDLRNRKMSPGLRPVNSDPSKSKPGPLHIEIHMPLPPVGALLVEATTGHDGNRMKVHTYTGHDGKPWVSFSNRTLGSIAIFQGGGDYYGVGSSRRLLRERRAAWKAAQECS